MIFFWDPVLLLLALLLVVKIDLLLVYFGTILYFGIIDVLAQRLGSRPSPSRLAPC